MLTDTFDNFADTLKSNSAPVVLFGAGDFGELALYALKKHDIPVSFFCDSYEDKQGKLFCGIKTLSPGELSKLAPDTHVFISNNYIAQVSSLVEKMGFKNIHNCVDLLESTDFCEGNDFSKGSLSSMRHSASHQWSSLKIKREVAIHKYSCDKAAKESSAEFNMKFMDIVITERCSLKCRDCANLMQYYTKPKNSDLDLLFKSTDRLMKCIDRIGELRVMGGDPLMNDQMFKVVNKLVKYEHAENIVIYTNAKILPKGENLTCLKNDKVSLLITDYGDLSTKHDELIELLDSNNILYITEPVLENWQDVGALKYEQKTTGELTQLFNSCCANDILTLLDGKLYRCPTAAHGENLGAIPPDAKDIVDLSDESISIEETREKLRDFYHNETYISACSYCKGREFGIGIVKSAIQTKKPLPLFV
ncbi:MAG: 4Fe-4S cluster-binding domain-containing protein [Nitrospina sp.]|jgi:hypothetical protein|nr:4Fe-4S cluster-binding domain-containing protein [Nitrospina sp.]